MSAKRPVDEPVSHIPYLDSTKWAELNIREKTALHQRDAVLAKLREFQEYEAKRKIELDEAYRRAEISEQGFKLLLDMVRTLHAHVTAAIGKNCVPSPRDMASFSNSVFGLFAGAVAGTLGIEDTDQALNTQFKKLCLLCDGIQRSQAGNPQYSSDLVAALLETKEKFMSMVENETAKAENDRLQRELTITDDKLKLSIQQADLFRQDKNRLLALKRRLEKENSELKTQLKNSATAAPSASIKSEASDDLRLESASLKAQLADLKQQVKHLQEEDEKAVRKLIDEDVNEAGNQPPSIESINVEREAWNKERTALEQQVRALKETVAAHANATSTPPPSLLEEISRLQTALSTQQEPAPVAPVVKVEIEETAKAALETADRLRGELKSATEKLAKWVAGHDGDDADIWEELANDVTTATESRDRALEELQSAREQIASNATQVLELNTKIQAAVDKVKVVSSEKEAAEQRAGKALVELDGAREAMDKLRVEIADSVHSRLMKEAETSAETARAANLEQKLLQLRQDKNRVERKLATLEKWKEHFNDALRPKNSEISDLGDRITGLEAEKRELLNILRGKTGADGQAVDLTSLVMKYEGLAKCPICKQNPRQRALRKCGHTFCKKCLDDRVATRERHCPSCNKRFDDTRDIMPIVIQT
ncbi:Zinc finger, C3HC4 type (RING finger) [Carpediemonas membranifera]|uniref:E3 ubiquitin protein ligase n=1 Tax=Carpediemonas membranifera TaxID=201153 RepID=A0A8J6B2K5_9EUKA|nr:Zinc finger, C3HC4 type (RING finger) [Carpediemonas membranifera]|eukprot:KAG9391637.1 Zinc finger, C3HC4 type (RING finger) [Carpediemonas membranifera]